MIQDEWPDPIAIPESFFSAIAPSDLEAVRHFANLFLHLKALEFLYSNILEDRNVAYHFNKILTDVTKLFKNGYSKYEIILQDLTNLAISTQFENKQNFFDYEVSYYSISLYESRCLMKSYEQYVGDASITTSWSVRIEEQIKARIDCAFPEEYRDELISCIA